MLVTLKHTHRAKFTLSLSGLTEPARVSRALPVGEIAQRHPFSSHAFKQRAAMSVYCTKTQQHYNTTTLETDREREKKEMRETGWTQKVDLRF